jgi:hypothetical protein
MTIDPAEAGTMLRDVDGTERRTREFLAYTRAGDYLIVWGVLWMIGYVASDYTAARTNDMWIALNVIGVVASTVITFRRRRGLETDVARALLVRPILAVAALMGFGVLWIVLAKFGVREQAAFWPTFCGTLLFVVGLWVGRMLSIGAAIIVALTLAGYFWSGVWLDLWLAIVGGGSLILGGLWLRR